jgi:hypothetical protein
MYWVLNTYFISVCKRLFPFIFETIRIPYGLGFGAIQFLHRHFQKGICINNSCLPFWHAAWVAWFAQDPARQKSLRQQKNKLINNPLGLQQQTGN